MTAYYNENDKFMAAWLRELMKENLIAPGEIDDRSIKDVDEKDLEGFTQCHFFAGVGVWSYALRKAGWPDDLPVWTGSCPCSSFSASGKRQGFSDPRHLWPTWGRLIQKCLPVVVFGEQVAKKDGYAWFDLVSSELETEGYTVGATDLPACGVGAPHLRNRIYFVAHTNRFIIRGLTSAGKQSLHEHGDETGGMVDAEWRRCEQRNARLGRVQESDTRRALDRMGLTIGEGLEGHARDVANGKEKQEATRPAPASGALNGFWKEDALWIHCEDKTLRPTRSGIFPLADGTPNRVGCLRGAGNALVAPAAQAFIESFIEVMH